MTSSQLTIIAASHHRADLLEAGARSRRTAEATRGADSPRSSHRWRHLGRRAAVA
jgi:hypothetical protein